MLKGYINPIATKLIKLRNNFEGYSLTCNNKVFKTINFSPGPTQLPYKVMNVIKDDIFENYTLGVTPFEISHRCPEFNHILENTNNKLRKFMKITDDFEILWTQGGGHGQFSAIPLNMKKLLGNNEDSANYLVTGTWSARAYAEASKFVNVRNSCKLYYNELNPLKYSNIPNEINISNSDRYLYLCSNETVNGTEFRKDGMPYPSRDSLNETKLIVDMSSDFGMKSVNWNDIDVAFACTSKNFGVAGANITIIRNSLLNQLKEKENTIPCTLEWSNYYETNSLYNTPAVFNIYLIEKILDYYLDYGIYKIEEESKIKSKMVYDILDNSNLYKPVVENKLIRSNINIPFIVDDGNDEIRSKFLEYCYINNVVGLRTKTPFKYSDFDMVEPLRISLYNGISIDDTKHLINVMKEFENIYINT
tara:strand:- start:1886 stop:3145 length:1260 start_codon:yes stop_codon:yes gene_type:complete